MYARPLVLIGIIVIVIMVTATLTLVSLTPKVYEDSEVLLTAEKGWNIEINGEDPISIMAASPEYFLLVSGKEYLFGSPMTSPLDLNDSYYFSLSDKIGNGIWKIEYGESISIKLRNDRPFSLQMIPSNDTADSETELKMITTDPPFSIKYFPSDDTIDSTIRGSMVLALLICAVITVIFWVTAD